MTFGLVPKWIGVALNLLLVTIGVLLIMLSAFLTAPWIAMLAAIGSAILGAVLGYSVPKISGLVSMSESSELLNALSPGIISEEHDARKFRKKWHFYHRTVTKEGLVWRSSVLDLRICGPSGRLLGVLKELKPDNKSLRTLNAEVGVWGDRVIMIMRPDSNEPPTVCIFPFMGKEHGGGQEAGIAIHESWNLTTLMSPIVISKEPIGDWQKRGTIDHDQGSEAIKKLVDIHNSSVASKVTIIDT